MDGAIGMLKRQKSIPMEILLVEDGLTDAKMTIFAIRRSRVHHRLTLVRGIADAEAFLSRSGVFALAPAVDLLLLDVMLPDGSGLEFLRRLDESTPAGEGITTVVLTASDNPDLQAECLQAGAVDFLRKPVQEADFARVVRDHKRLMVTADPNENPAATASGQSPSSSGSSSRNAPLGNVSPIAMR